MLPVLRLCLLTLAALLFTSSAAHAAKGLSVAVPAEGQVAVAVGSGVKSLKATSAPAGVTVAGGVRKGRFAVAVIRPRGVAAAGKVKLTVRGKAKGVKTFAAALSSGRVRAGCADLGKLLGKRLKGKADVKALGGVLAAKLCGKLAPAGADGVLAKLGLGVLPPQPGSFPSPPARPSAPPPVARPQRPVPTATATATPRPPVGRRACDNKIDDDGDGQVDWEDPGCEHAGDMSEDSEIPAPPECVATSGIGMSPDDPTELTVGINPGCGEFWDVEVHVAPGVYACSANNGYTCEVYAPIASAHLYDGQRDAVDISLELVGPVDCSKKATIGISRLDGRVYELQMFVRNCKTLPMPPRKCMNGKDDDGDGLIDSHLAPGATDPDPGCDSPTDRYETGEVPAPETCEIQLGLLGGDKRTPGMRAVGCGVLKGAWFRPPGTPTDCGYWFMDEVLGCDVNAGSISAAFGLTNMSFTMATHITADHDCRPVTVALIPDVGATMYRRQAFC